MATDKHESCLEPISDKVLASWLPIPDSQSHKYSRGKAVLIGGSKAYPGAACLASCAAQFVGAGYTEVFTDSENKALLQGFRPSLVVRSFDEVKPDSLCSSTYPGAVVFGPGADGEDKCLKELLPVVISQTEKPLLIDGGALGMLASDENLSLLKERFEKGFVTVLTPHGGEAARLAKAAEIQKSEDDQEYAQTLANACGCFVVLKGPKTFIASPEDAVEFSGFSESTDVYLFDKGTPALAKAGTGDVLAGIIGGLLAQGVDAFKAAVLGVNLHAKAAFKAIDTYSLISTSAEEVLQSLPAVLADLEKGK